MQHLPHDVLQEPQRQRESQETGSEGGGRARTATPAASRGASGGYDGTEEAEQSRVLSHDRSHATPSASSTPLHGAARPLRRPGPQIRQRGGGGLRPELATPSPFTSTEHLRPSPGSGTTGASSRESAATAIPPQLMGAGVAANANVLASDTPEYAMFINDAAYHANEQAEGLPSPAFLSPLWSTR